MVAKTHLFNRIKRARRFFGLAHNGSLDCLWTPITIGRNKLLGVESSGGPENQDEKVVRGVH